MLGGSLGSTKVPEVLVWQGVCPGDRSPAFKLPAESELEERSGVAVQPKKIYRILYIPGRENVGADYMSRAGML